MQEEILIPLSFFAAVFGIVYLYFSTRNKERLALIEKGADASIFNMGKRSGSSWKVIIINVAFLLMGIGLGSFIASLIDEYTTLNDGANVAVVFFMAGVGLYVGYTQTKKALDE
ncbi:CPP1-like family protein [Winogradskyella poriferorum]|uniref:CPP1-like family protein n=1 Tax=Winogradskyella poriferorum TaxID=307627 RepID=UPI003D64FA7F